MVHKVNSNAKIKHHTLKNNLKEDWSHLLTFLNLGFIKQALKMLLPLSYFLLIFLLIIQQLYYLKCKKVITLTKVQNFEIDEKTISLRFNTYFCI